MFWMMLAAASVDSMCFFCSFRMPTMSLASASKTVASIRASTDALAAPKRPFVAVRRQEDDGCPAAGLERPDLARHPVRHGVQPGAAPGVGRIEGVQRRVEPLDLTVTGIGEVRGADFLAFDQFPLFG